jgi:glycosyltransferase involved in cell wall biosynthesis
MTVAASTSILFTRRPGSDPARELSVLGESVGDVGNLTEIVDVPDASDTERLNEAAGRATGEFLCFVSGVTLFPERWLPGLRKPLDTLPSAGATGAMLVNERNQVVEAGRTVLADGQLRPISRGRSPVDRRCQFVNDVDSLSSRCLLIRRETFLRTGGFSAHYRTWSYRDADFGLKLAALGLRALLCPAVLASIEEPPLDPSGESPTDLGADRNDFVQRFNEVLKARPNPSTVNDEVLRVSKRRGTILWHFIRTPTWDRDSGALRLKLLLLGLADRGYHVVMVSPMVANPYFAELEAHGIETVQADSSDHPALRAVILGYRPDAAIFSHAETEQRFAAACHAWSPETIRVLDTVDLHFVRETRRRGARLGFKTEPTFSPETLSPAALEEISSGIRSDATLVVSPAERDLLVDQLSFDPHMVRVVSNVHVPEVEQRPWHERDGFLFLGGFTHPPNVDSIKWIVSEIWPLVRQRRPNAHLKIVGSAAPPEVRSLHDPAFGIEVVGFVDNHRAALAGARVMLAPLAYGAGVKGKVGEALAVGTVVVTNHIGAEGMDPHGRALGVGRDPESLADLAASLHDDRSEWLRRSTAGLELLHAQYSIEHHVGELLAAIDVARQKRSEPSLWTLVRDYLWHERANQSPACDTQMAVKRLRWQRRSDRRALDALRARVAKLMERDTILTLAVSASGVRRLGTMER